MRLTVLFLMALSVTVARNAPGPDLTGIWVAELARSDIGTSPCPNRLILNVTQNGDGLKVIEVSTGQSGAYVAERQYRLQGAVRRARLQVGIARIAGRTAVLRFTDQLERWRISDDGSELFVKRRIGISRKATNAILVFRRSNGTAAALVVRAVN